jgi:hypothetical protein
MDLRSNQPLTETNDTDLEVEVEVNLRPTVSRPVCLGVRRPSGTRDQFFYHLEISFRQMRVCYFVSPSLTRGWVCNLLCNCFLTLPEQSHLGRSPAELTAIFYFLIWDSPKPWGPGPRIYIPQEQGGPVIPPGTGFPFVASYDSEGYGGGILTRLHMGPRDLPKRKARPVRRDHNLTAICEPTV